MQVKSRWPIHHYLSSIHNYMKEVVKEEDMGREGKSLIFKFADTEDVVLMGLGTLGAVGDGMLTNFLLALTSNIVNSLGKRGQNFMDEVEKCCIYFVYLGIANLVVAFLEGYCWTRTSERQVLRLRYRYLEAVLRQEVGFFEAQEETTSDIINSISNDASVIQEVLSEKIPTFIMHTSVFISGMCFSTYMSWRLSIVSLPLLLLLIIPGIIYGKYLLYLSRTSSVEYGRANAVVEQALGSIKTVYSFTAEKAVVERYKDKLDRVLKVGISQGIAKGLAVGCTGLSFAIWGFLAWYGSRLVFQHGESGGRIFASGVTFVLGGLALGKALPEVKHITEASVAVTRIISRIERKPLIDDDDPNGVTPPSIHGHIEFSHVCFAYPCRPETTVLDDFNLVVPAGKTVALVGGSGSGKSTVVGLLQRFYDCEKGEVKVDGVDIRQLQLKWVRQRMGLVGQDHALFGASVRENILIGKPEATMDEVVFAAVAANAHEFVRRLPEGYETKVGERGALLSGGQKQRIAIARAILKNPAILILDEATSALDSESEEVVQTALCQASTGRTTLVVAHKLSTIRNADQIAVMDGGRIVEIGTHIELISRDGHYSQLVNHHRQFSHLEDQESTESHLTRSSAGRTSIARSSSMSFPSELQEKCDVNPAASYQSPSFIRLLSMNSAEWKQALIGSISAVVFGSLQPIYAFTLGSMISAFFVPDHNEMQKVVRRYSLVFSSLSAISIIVNLLQHYNFAYMGELLTRRIRLQMLEKILSFECSWFDEECNSSGALCSQLSTEASIVKTIVADRVSLLVQTVSGAIISVTLGLVVAWKLALVMIFSQPFVMLCYYFKKIVLSRAALQFIRAQGFSSQIAKEAVCNHRIITSYGCSSVILRLFEKAQEEPCRAAKKKALIAGATMGISPCLSFVFWALAFWYGGKLTFSGEISASDVFKTFFILVTTGKVIAEAGTMTSDLAKGTVAVLTVFSILDRQSLIVKSSQKANLDRIQGNVNIVSVDFAYPSRPKSTVLQDFSLEVKAGDSIGLVGSSGCGKSSVIGLVQRFYDVDRGSIRIDGMDIRAMDVNWYRSFTSLVSQDPVIFSGSIHENITFGKSEASSDEVLAAARAANAHEFISAMKDGYDTVCGERGVKLSGGQKQRIAIARAIIRNPTILMLDEATSALDAQSERVVQEALDGIMVGRTTIVVAHRLNTIKNLNSIAVMKEGNIVERGSYMQLMNKQGAFFKLAGLQTRDI